MPWKTFLVQPFIEVLQASKDLPDADRDWVCPVKNCGAALPKQATKRARTKAVVLIALLLTRAFR